MSKGIKNYDPKDIMFSSVVFANVLSFIIPKGTGIVMDLPKNRRDSHPEITRVIVHNKGAMIAVEDATKRTDLKNGSFIQMINGDELKN